RLESRRRYRCRWPQAARQCIVRWIEVRWTGARHSYARKYMKFSPLVQRISGEGADAWLTHYEASAARERGADVIILSVGDLDLDTPAAVVDKAIERLRAGDTDYSPAAGRVGVREVIAAYHSSRTGLTD